MEPLLFSEVVKMIMKTMTAATHGYVTVESIMSTILRPFYSMGKKISGILIIFILIGESVATQTDIS